jgi:hypothetical protein
LFGLFKSVIFLFLVNQKSIYEVNWIKDRKTCVYYLIDFAQLFKFIRSSMAFPDSSSNYLRLMKLVGYYSADEDGERWTTTSTHLSSANTIDATISIDYMYVFSWWSWNGQSFPENTPGAVFRIVT